MSTSDRVLERVHSVNPFKNREAHSRGSIIAYKICTVVTWLVLVVTSFYYTFNKPHEGKHKRRTIWGQNKHHATPFALNAIITSIYWIVLFISQIGYVWHLFASNVDVVYAAANVGSHFIFNNLLYFGFVMLWVRSYFWLAELLLVINFVNLTTLYFRHPTAPLAIHVPVVSGPLAFNNVAIFWVGAAAVNAHSLAARIVANVFVWEFLTYGAFYLFAFKDYSMGFAMSVLTAALGTSQFLTHVVALQWIFAFVIMAILFVVSFGVAVPSVAGGTFKFGREEHVVSEDVERAPLLAE
ncbi:MAG: hypothetical protein M1819_003160 [Sarea resinae]|nr:MAG: hypothetical protein M1819_003160 [Sarea resinae]